MILPNKYIREDEALIGFGAVILGYLTKDQTMSELWEEVKNLESVGNFERFIMVLDMLYLLGLVEFKKNKLKRVAS